MSSVNKKKIASAEDIMIKIPEEASISVNLSSFYESSVAAKKLTSAEDCMSEVTSTEPDLSSESSVAMKRHTFSEDCIRKVSLEMLYQNIGGKRSKILLS